MQGLGSRGLRDSLKICWLGQEVSQTEQCLVSQELAA